MLINTHKPCLKHCSVQYKIVFIFSFVKVEKKDEEIEALKEDIADLKDQVTAAEEDRDKANDKEERLLEECEKLNQAVDDLEDQLKAVSSVYQISIYNVICCLGVLTDREKYLISKKRMSRNLRTDEYLLLFFCLARRSELVEDFVTVISEDIYLH